MADGNESDSSGSSWVFYDRDSETSSDTASDAPYDSGLPKELEESKHPTERARCVLEDLPMSTGLEACLEEPVVQATKAKEAMLHPITEKAAGEQEILSMRTDRNAGLAPELGPVMVQASLQASTQLSDSDQEAPHQEFEKSVAAEQFAEKTEVLDTAQASSGGDQVPEVFTGPLAVLQAGGKLDIPDSGTGMQKGSDEGLLPEILMGAATVLQATMQPSDIGQESPWQQYENFSLVSHSRASSTQCLHSETSQNSASMQGTSENEKLRRFWELKVEAENLDSEEDLMILHGLHDDDSRSDDFDETISSRDLICTSTEDSFYPSGTEADSEAIVTPTVVAFSGDEGEISDDDCHDKKRSFRETDSGDFAVISAPPPAEITSRATSARPAPQNLTTAGVAAVNPQTNQDAVITAVGSEKPSRRTANAPTNHAAVSNIILMILMSITAFGIGYLAGNVRQSISAEEYETFVEKCIHEKDGLPSDEISSSQHAELTALREANISSFLARIKITNEYSKLRIVNRHLRYEICKLKTESSRMAAVEQQRSALLGDTVRAFVRLGQDYRKQQQMHELNMGRKDKEIRHIRTDLEVAKLEQTRMNESTSEKYRILQEELAIVKLHRPNAKTALPLFEPFHNDTPNSRPQHYYPIHLVPSDFYSVNMTLKPFMVPLLHFAQRNLSETVPPILPICHLNLTSDPNAFKDPVPKALYKEVVKKSAERKRKLKSKRAEVIKLRKVCAAKKQSLKAARGQRQKVKSRLIVMRQKLKHLQQEKKELNRKLRNTTAELKKKSSFKNCLRLVLDSNALLQRVNGSRAYEEASKMTRKVQNVGKKAWNKFKKFMSENLFHERVKKYHRNDYDSAVRRDYEQTHDDKDDDHFPNTRRERRREFTDDKPKKNLKNKKVVDEFEKLVSEFGTGPREFHDKMKKYHDADSEQLGDDYEDDDDDMHGTNRKHHREFTRGYKTGDKLKKDLKRDQKSFDRQKEKHRAQETVKHWGDSKRTGKYRENRERKNHGEERRYSFGEPHAANPKSHEKQKSEGDHQKNGDVETTDSKNKGSRSKRIEEQQFRPKNGSKKHFCLQNQNQQNSEEKYRRNEQGSDFEARSKKENGDPSAGNRDAQKNWYLKMKEARDEIRFEGKDQGNKYWYQKMFKAREAMRDHHDGAGDWYQVMFRAREALRDRSDSDGDWYQGMFRAREALRDHHAEGDDWYEGTFRARGPMRDHYDDSGDWYHKMTVEREKARAKRSNGYDSFQEWCQA